MPFLKQLQTDCNLAQTDLIIQSKDLFKMGQSFDK